MIALHQTDDSHVVIHAMPKEYTVRQDILSALFPFHDPPLSPGTSDRVLMKSATSIYATAYHY